MPRLAVMLALIMLPLAGCVGPEIEAATTTEAPAEVRSLVAGEITLGSIAAVGVNLFVGDFVVGAHSHEQCPGANFIVPGQVDLLRLTIGGGSGMGMSTVALSGPDGVTYLNPELGEDLFELERPAEGPWRLEVKPVGATVNEAIDLLVEIEGIIEQDAILFVKDGGCLL